MAPALDQSRDLGQVAGLPRGPKPASKLRRALRAEWLRIADSYDPDEAVSGSEPGAIVAAAGSLAVLFAVLGYAPFVVDHVRFEQPWLSIALSLVGGSLTYLAHRHRCRGPIGTAATLLDNSFYSAALAFAAASIDGPVGIGVAATHGLMVVLMPARVYGLTPSFAFAMAWPLVFALLAGRPSEPVTLILLCGLPIAAVTSMITANKRRMLRQRAQLSAAVGLTTRAADESMQLALGSTLLSLGNFLHELKNLQTAVRVNLSFLAQQSGLDDDAREALAEALESQQAEQRLVRETIDALKRRTSPAQERFRLEDALVPLQSEAKSIPVGLGSSMPELDLVGSAETLRVVLVNLVRNADEAGASRVHMSARLEPGGHAVKLLVEDDGPGVPEAQREKLFSAQLESSKHNGTGLGLYLCRKHVELMGGTIELLPSERGAVFAIVLPTARSFVDGTPEPPRADAPEA